ncbi:MAG TPA: IS110 family transposase [Terriglobia bacterium]|nr:IS110 family transposase [Terriglobia bacterium]
MNTTDYAALVAMDWGDKTHAFACQKTGADGIEQGMIEATPEALHAWLEKLRETCGGRPVALAVEAGRNALLHALLEHAWLTVYPVHPATSARFRKAFTPSGAKDDGPDALVILTLLRQHRAQLTALVQDTPATRELAALVAARRGAVDARTRLVNQLTSLLKGYFPQALTLAGDNLAAPLALAFLRRFPELADAQKAGAARLRAFYAKHNVRSQERIEVRLALLARARPLSEDRAVIGPARMELPRLLDLLEVETRHIATMEGRIAEVFAAHPKAELFASLPGAGAALAPRLLTAFGDVPARYPNAQALQKYAGLAPVREKSQGRLWVHWRWAAPKFVRQSFVEWAGQTVPRCAWANEFYRRQKTAGKGHHAILRALAFKWLRILWRCWTDGMPYDETRYLAALAKRGSLLNTTP